MTAIVPLRVVAGAVLLVALSLTVLAGLAYQLWKGCREASKVRLPKWRRVVTIAGFVAVTVQGAMFVAFWGWPSIGRDYALLSEWSRWVLASFVVAVPGLLAGTGASRRWLLSSSAFLFVICFLFVLSV